MKRFVLGLALALSLGGVASAKDLKTAIFAGGCFWCVESDYDSVPGVLDTTSGYEGGSIANPTYENHPRYAEAVKITYDADQVSYDHLLDIFWHSTDPTDAGGQFCDRGASYRNEIFPLDQTQMAAAEKSRAQAQTALGQKIVTEITPATKFWPAEDYHQDYYTKNPLRYTFYRRSCGRDARVRALWGAQAFEHESS